MTRRRTQMSTWWNNNWKFTLFPRLDLHSFDAVTIIKTMWLIHGVRQIFLLLCFRVGQYSALAPIRLPIFDVIFQKSNNFNESIYDTNIFLPEYDFIVIGAGSGMIFLCCIQLSHSCLIRFLLFRWLRSGKSPEWNTWI